jgi:hypothetical protein
MRIADIIPFIKFKLRTITKHVPRNLVYRHPITTQIVLTQPCLRKKRGETDNDYMERMHLELSARDDFYPTKEKCEYFGHYAHADIPYVDHYDITSNGFVFNFKKYQFFTNQDLLRSIVEIEKETLTSRSWRHFVLTNTHMFHFQQVHNMLKIEAQIQSLRDQFVTHEGQVKERMPNSYRKAA